MVFKVKIRPGEREVEAGEGTSLLEIIAESGLYIESLCSGKGICGRCVVKIEKGASSPSESEERILGTEGTGAGLRLACTTGVNGDMDVAVTGEEELPQWKGDPSTPFQRSSSVLELLEEGNFVIKIGRSRVFLGNVSDHLFGVAMDAGTTTIEALLVDMMDGSIRGKARELNRQGTSGSDIISRISYGTKSEGNRDHLRKLLLQSMEKAIEELCRVAGIGRENIVACALSGNVFIINSFLGKSLGALARFPYSPPMKDTLLLADSLPLPMSEKGCVVLFPAPGAFIGGDLVAGAVSLSLDDEGEPAILMDIGTNTEILLRRGNRWVAASAPSGGTFEGAQIKCGKMALPGAVTDVLFDTELNLRVIGDREPDGISGSGVLSLVSLLLSMNVLTRDGRLLTPAEARATAPPGILWRLAEIEGERAFILFLPERGKRPVYFCQSDVRSVQTAKGAIRAGIEACLTELGLTSEDVGKVFVSGAFGREAKENSLIGTGMFPREFSGRVVKAGNTSLSGAYLSLVERDVMTRAKDFAGNVSVLHLGANRVFSERFVGHMNF